MAAAADSAPTLVQPVFIGGVVLALGLLGTALASPSVWLLDFVHVLAGLLWTGVDLFMGFVIGPILRGLGLEARRAFITRLMPRMLYLMPTLSIVTGTAGWFLAGRLGYLDLPYPEFGWVAAALVLLAILTIEGLGILLPTNLAVYFELRKEEPDGRRIGRLMRTYILVVAIQGVMQIAMIVIMARFATGL